MRYRRLDVPVQKDGEGSERNKKKLEEDLHGFEPRHPESESDILTN